jgi:purine-binding chemotaxis protein CheW
MDTQASPTPTAGTEHSPTDYLIFQLGEERYALPTSCVREVARLAPITPVPGTPRELPGIISRHGTVLPVVDARPLLGLPQQEARRSSRLLSVWHDEIELVLLADGVFDMLELAPSSFAPPPTALDPARATLLVGIANIDEQPLALLDLDALIAQVRDGG